ncbi:MAG: iron complex outermembrane receptor protein, partial [Alcanivorax sp.]
MAALLVYIPMDALTSTINKNNLEIRPMIPKTLLSLAVTAALATLAIPAQVNAQEPDMLEEVIVIGTRSQKARSVSDSPVPVDVLSGEEFNSQGNSVDITENLRTLVPSFTATPLSGDGSAFVRPTSLRGTSPDQVLILVNGKRRHRAALVTVFAPAAGNGAHGVDIGMIPSLGLKSVEVLRDGAAAQYGSDAIAGVMNFRMKDDREGGKVLVQYGEHYEGEQTVKVGANGGFALGENGFLNLTGEWQDNEPLDRAVLRPDTRQSIADGLEGLGQDTPFDDAPLTQSWGRPESSGYRLFFNSGYDLSDTSELYLHGNYADVSGRYRFFHREAPVPSTGAPVDAQVQALVDLYGYQGRLLETGFTAYLDGDQEDYSLVGGLRGSFDGGLYYDISVGLGVSEIEYTLNNAVNVDVGLGPDGEPAQMKFDVGSYEQEEVNLNADFSQPIGDNLNLGFGAEWREETFTANVGEPNTTNGGTSGSGYSSPTVADAGEFDRDNWAIYGDLEHDISDSWLMQYAVRYEDFSDFGDTTNFKVATRFNATDWLTLRGAVSTGFHAPTPGQTNLQQVITTFDGVTGEQVEQGLIKATSPEAVAVGGTALTEETSLNYSFGFSSDIGDSTTLTLDFYLIEVDDRIYRTGDIEKASGDGVVSFYTNTLDVEHKGIDLVLNSNYQWSGGVDTSFTFAYNHNEIEVVDQALINGIQTVSDGLIEDIENNYPEDRFVFTANTHFADNWSLMLRANYYGEHFDERGRIDGDFGNRSKEIGSVIYVDLELGWDVTENINLTFGGANIFDEYIDEIDAGGQYANRIGVGLAYPR